MDFKSYPNYKDSGIEWIGNIPKHWEIVRTKEIFHHRKEDALPNDEIVTAFRDGQVTLRKNRRTDGFTNSFKEHGYQHIECGDLVIHEMDAFAGAIGVSDSSGKSTPVYTVCYAKNSSVNHYFYSFLFREMSRIGFISSLAKGIRVRSTEFRWSESRNVYLAYPPISEQNKIVSFLHSETSRIDNLISKQEKLIEKLEEHRKSVISHAVTKGLDQNIKMKDSGIEWLGEIPEHWQTASIKYLCKIDTGNMDTVDAIDNGKYPFFVRSQKIESINEYSFDGEAVLTAGDGAGVGKIYHYINGKFNYHQRVYKMSNFYKVTGKFFFLYFSSLFARVALDGGAKSTVDSLRKAHFDKFIMTFPTVEEQEKIVQYISHKCEKIDTLIAKQRELIAKLKNYRTSIISHAVTGKIDVRDLVA